MKRSHTTSRPASFAGELTCPAGAGSRAVSVLVTVLAVRLGRLARGLRRLALRSLALHLLHRGTVVVEAELPWSPTEALDGEPGRLAADRAAFLEPPQLVAPPGKRA